MKVIKCILGVLFLFSICNCSESEDLFESPSIRLEYIDMSAKNLTEIIEGFDPERMVRVDDKNIFEIISLKDQSGKDVSFFVLLVGGKDPYLEVVINETYTPYDVVKNREYNMTYKIPSLLDNDRIEELRLVYDIKNGCRFTETWYNGKKLKLTNISLLIPDIPDKNAIDWDAVRNEAHNIIYCGESNAYITDNSFVNLVLLVE